jgi:hypothetical protein
MHLLADHIERQMGNSLGHTSHGNLLAVGAGVFSSFYRNHDVKLVVVLLDTPTSERELAAGLDKKRGWFCQDCGHHWHAEEIQFRCTYPPCRHNDLARYNTAMVVAQLTIRKLLEYNQQQSQGTPAGTADS